MSILWMFSNISKSCIAANTLWTNTIFEVKKLLETNFGVCKAEFSNTELKPNVNQKGLYMRIKGQ